VELTAKQKQILDAGGHLLVTGGPGSGKTTVSILKAARAVESSLKSEQKVLFLSFARATVSRVLEAIEQERGVSKSTKRRIEVDTYHSFFWKLLKAHGYLLGLPRKISVLTPSAEAVALSEIRSGFGAKPSEAEAAEKAQTEESERKRLAREEGRICFDLFAELAGILLNGSRNLRGLISNAYPTVILDEFQDTNSGQWDVIQCLGDASTLLALADPEQRIFDWIGADPARLDQFREKFEPTEVDLGSDNHRSAGTDIATFGNHLLTGKFGQEAYNGIEVVTFEANPNQAFSTLRLQAIHARKRLLDAGIPDWSLAVLVPTKKLTRLVSDKFRNDAPLIDHTAILDTEPIVLAAEVIALLMQPSTTRTMAETVGLLCDFFKGKGGDSPSKSNLQQATSLQNALEKAERALAAGKAAPGNSIIVAVSVVLDRVAALQLSGDPDTDWVSVREALENGPCARLKEVAAEARNLRLLNRGTELRNALATDWRENGSYRNALAIVRSAFVQEHFSTSHRPERGVVVMNMHKAKGKQFDEVIAFEGWPLIARGKLIYNAHRFVRENSRECTAREMTQAKQNFRVTVTRAKVRTTILTPRIDPSIFLIPSS
jgi:DNA helicase-2/ATP-dependent DNA helicase PcrA